MLLLKSNHKTYALRMSVTSVLEMQATLQDCSLEFGSERTSDEVSLLPAFYYFSRGMRLILHT